VSRQPSLPLIERRIAIGIVVLGAICAGRLIYQFGLAWITFGHVDFEPMPFDSAVWRATASESTHDSIRVRMVDDYLATHSPIGRTRDEVAADLGEPHDTARFHEYDMVYRLGLERDSAFPIDSEWLVIRLDENAMVSEALLTTD